MPRVTAAMVAAGRSVGEPRLSPDGRTVAFVAASGGRADLVVVPVTGGAEQVLTTEPAPVAARGYGGGVFDWAPGGDGAVYAAVDGGLWWQPAAGGPPRLVVDPEPEERIAAPAVSPDGTRVAYSVDESRIEVAALAGGGDPTVLSATPDFAFDPTWSPDSRRIAWHEWDVPDMPWDASRVVVADADGSGEPEVVAGGDGVWVAQPRFGPEGRLAWLDDEDDGWLRLRGAPYDADGVPGEHGDASWGQGIRSWCWSPDGTEVAVRTNVDGYGELVAGGRSLGRGVHGAVSWAGGTVAALRSGARTPPQIVAYDVASGERTVLAHAAVAGWDELDLPEPEVLRTADGVVARLYAAGDGPRPLICWVHGGPTDQWPVAWRSRFPYILDRGWSILVPDHRGSTGHGRAYRQALHGGWGDVDVADCAAATRAVVDQGRADPSRVVAMGGSAGGFTTLLLLAHHPDLYAAGVALSAVTDLRDLAERTHRFERHYTHHLIGPLPGSEALHRERSPLAVVGRITAPVLVLHGSADLLVPVSQAEDFVARLGAAGGDVELQVYDGEGHGWSNPLVVVDELARIEGFLDRHVMREVGG